MRPASAPQRGGQIVVLTLMCCGLQQGTHEIGFIQIDSEISAVNRRAERSPYGVVRVLRSTFGLLHKGPDEPYLNQPASKPSGFRKRLLAGINVSKMQGGDKMNPLRT